MELAKRARIVAMAMAVASSVLLPPAVAQEISEEHLSAARAAIDAINATDEYDVILPRAALALKSELIQQSPNLEEMISQTVDDKALELAPRRAALEEEAALAYARIFTQEDLQNIANFYNSPTGKKLLSDGPIVTREVRQAADIWRRGILRDLNEGVMQAMQSAVGAQAPTIESEVPEGAEGADTAAPEAGADSQ